MLNLASFNVRGMSDNIKRREIFKFLHHKPFDCILLQETHSTIEIENIWQSEWGGRIWYSHGSSNARGVAVLFSRNLNYVVENVSRDLEGRSLFLNVRIKDKLYTIGNFNGLNSDCPQFFQDRFAELEAFGSEFKILAGDWNTILDPILDRKGISENTFNKQGGRND